MGKWTNIVKGLPEVPVDDAKRAELAKRREMIVEAVTKSREAAGKEGPPTTADFVEKFQFLRELEDDIESELKEVTSTLEALKGLLVERYEAEGLQKVTLEDGSSVAIEVEPYAGVKDKAAFKEYCLKDEELFMALSLPWATLNSMVKEMLQEGQELPPGVEVFLKSKAVLRKGK